MESNESEPPPHQCSHACRQGSRRGRADPLAALRVTHSAPSQAAPGLPSKGEVQGCRCPSHPGCGEKALCSASVPNRKFARGKSSPCPSSTALPGKPVSDPLEGREGGRPWFCTPEMARITEQQPGCVRSPEPARSASARTGTHRLWGALPPGPFPRPGEQHSAQPHLFHCHLVLFYFFFNIYFY